MASLVRIWIVRYVDRAGTRVPKGAPGARKVKERSTVWYGQYKDASGRYRRKPLYTDKEASRVKLAGLVKAVERGEAGLVSPYKDALKLPIEKHEEEYLAHLRTEGVNPKHLDERRRILRAVLSRCEIKTLGDLDASGDRINSYLANLAKRPTKNNPHPGPASARTKDTHRAAVHAFAEWLVSRRPPRLPSNPVSGTAKPRGDEVHRRRSETIENLQRLLTAARERPLLEARTVRKGPRSGERYAEVRPAVRGRLEQVGRERALIYKTAILTGLREGELRRLRAGDLRLDDSPAVFVAPAHDRKNKTAIWLPLLPDHAAELALWLKDAGRTPTDHVFYVPEKPNKIFRRDLACAGVAYKDEHGRYFDFHSLRHCTDTYLNAAGVSPSVVMLFMRHRHIKLSLQTYNDPRMHDARRALAALPTLI